MKRKLAFTWTAQAFAGGRRFLYLWTFTFVERLEVDEACARWNTLLTVLRREFGVRWSGLRAYEMHPGSKSAEHYDGHGLHIHCVGDERFYPHELSRFQKLARLCRMGNVDVQMIDSERADYLAKYLGKKRHPALKNKRLVAPFGARARLHWRRLSDVGYESAWTRMFQFVKALVPNFQALSWWQKQLVVKNGLVRDLQIRFQSPGHRIRGLHDGIQSMPFFADAFDSDTSFCF